MSNEVVIESQPNGWDVYVINGEHYPVREDDTVEGFLKYSRHYALLAKYLDSPEQKEHRRLKAARAEIAKRYGLDTQNGYQMTPTIRSMIEDILKLEEAAK